MNYKENEKNNHLSPAVIEQLRRGNIIEAIKLLRQETGLSLKDAKDLIDESNKETSQNLNYDNKKIFFSEIVLNHLREGKKIDAIKALRNETGMGLKDAKEMVEEGLIEYPDVKIRYDAENKRGVIGFFLFLIAVIIIALFIYFTFKK